MAVNQTAENKIKTEAGLTEALAYITNPAKISEVSRLNCSGSNSNTLDQFRLLRLAFNQNKGIIAHHFIQSFAPNDNVTPETVHRFGVEYAKLCFPNYQVVVSRINNEIKRLAAINGEKPKYRMVAPELLDNIKQSGIQFAYFKKGDKYNIVFLRENEMKIDQLLKQFRKKN